MCYGDDLNSWREVPFILGNMVFFPPSMTKRIMVAHKIEQDLCINNRENDFNFTFMDVVKDLIKNMTFKR